MLLKGQKGFTLVEVVVSAALIGIMAAMLMPSLSGANERVKNAKLSNDLTAVDQAIQMYKMDNGKVPDSLTALDNEYLSGKLEFKDAIGESLVYSAGSDGSKYTLSGKNSKGVLINSPGSSADIK